MSSQNLKNQVALVTGGAGGIGSAICTALASRGCDIAVHYFRHREKAEALKTELQHSAVKVAVFYADLRSSDDVDRMIDGVTEHFGRLDILINNAGWSKLVPPSDLAGLTDGLIQETLALKIYTPVYTIRAAAPFLRKSENGNIINITSAAGVASRGSSIIYAAANAALYSLTKSFARILSPNVRVNAVAPGFVETGFVFPADGKMAAEISRQNYTGRIVKPEEIACAVAFLCADAPSITGEELVIDGGIARLWKKF